MRTCSTCRVSKPATLDFFYKKGANSLSSRCKECSKAITKQWELDNKERKREYRKQERYRVKARVRNRRWLERHPEYRSEYLAVPEHRERNKERASLWREANPERVAAYFQTEKFATHNRANVKRWGKENPLKRAAIFSLYKARKRGATIEDVDFELQWERYEHKCYLCLLLIDATISNLHDRAAINWDHIVPISRGGKHSNENVAPTHAICNQMKHDFLLTEIADKTLSWRKNSPINAKSRV